MKTNTFFKSLAFAVFTFAVIASANATPIDRSLALTAARNFLSAKCPSLATASLSETPKTAGLENLYIFNISNRGFLVLSADDHALPVLAYSFEHPLDLNSIGDNTLYWLRNYNREIEYSKTKPASDETLQAWQHLLTGTSTPAPKTVADSVAPLINSTWRQYIGYNNLCPVDTTLPSLGGHPTVGCVALAMAQIMRYWHFPAHGMGSLSYTYEGEYDCWRYGTLSADFGSTYYDWDNMPTALTDSSTDVQINAVATICYHAAVSAYMMFNSDCEGSSGSHAGYAAEGFQSAFHYKCQGAFSRSQYNTNTWVNALKTDISSGRPVLYGGQSIEDTTVGTHGGGHAFIFDGYDADSYFHVNWGWGGYADGYFQVTALNATSSYAFNSGQNAVLGLEPEYGAIAFPALVQGITLDGEDFQMGGTVSGSYAVANVGDTVYDGYIGVNVYQPNTYDFYGWLDATEVHIQPGDTVFRTFSNPGMTRPVGRYYALGQYNATPLYVTDTVDNALACFNNGMAYFNSVDSNRSVMHNLVSAVRFAGEDSLTLIRTSLNSNLNSTVNSVFSALRYIDNATNGNTNYKSVLCLNNGNPYIEGLVDTNSRNVYLPYSGENPEGFLCGNNYNTRLSLLLNSVVDFIAENQYVNENTIIDCDGDGFVDNLTIIVSNGDPILNGDQKVVAGEYEGTIKLLDRKIKHYTLIPESSDISNYCYSLLRSLDLPNLTHTGTYTDLHPAGTWDMLDNANKQQPSAIFKHLYLHVGDAPQTITSSGWYTLNSNSSNTSPMLYTLPIDENSFYTFEYRNQQDFFDQGIPSSGLLLGIYNTTGDNSNYDSQSTPNLFWVMRPNWESDTTDGNIQNAAINGSANIRLSEAMMLDSVYVSGNQLFFHIFSNDNSISESSTNDNISIYPNPASDFITINCDNMQKAVIYNSLGQQALSFTTNKADISTLPNGIYTIRIDTPKGSIIKKIVKR